MLSRFSGGGNRTTLLLGVVLAVLGFGLTLLLGRGGGGGGTGVGTGSTLDVVVAARDLGPSTKIAAADLLVTKLPSGAVPPHSFRTREQVIGKVVAITIYSNEPVVDNLVVASADQIPVISAPTLHIPQGFVATSIPTNELAGVSGAIQPGDHIDIIASLNPTVAGPNVVPEARFTFRDLPIIKVNGAASGTGGTSLVVLVKYEDADYLKFLLDNTTYKYVLRSNLDQGQTIPAGAGVGANEFKARFNFH